MSVSILSNRTVDFLDDINAKYATLECEIEQKLASICSDEKKFEKTYSIKRVTFEDKLNKSCTDLESAKRRNADLIKELEISKVRLRSRATYSPLEQVLKKAIDNYANNSHLRQSTIRRKFGPTYVEKSPSPDPPQWTYSWNNTSILPNKTKRSDWLEQWPFTPTIDLNNSNLNSMFPKKCCRHCLT